MPIPETLEFADWNKGKSFFEQYELLGPDGRGAHICIDIRDEVHARELARRVVACWNACAGLSTEGVEAIVRRRRGLAANEHAEVLALLTEAGYPLLEEIEQAIAGLEKLVSTPEATW